MTAKRCWQAVLLLTVALASGCGHFCDKWCQNHHQAAAAPVCCYPVQPVCPPGTTPAVATTATASPGWNQPAVPCVPCR